MFPTLRRFRPFVFAVIVATSMTPWLPWGVGLALAQASGYSAEITKIDTANKQVTLKASMGQQTMRTAARVPLKDFKPGDKVLVKFGQEGTEAVVISIVLVKAGLLASTPDAIAADDPADIRWRSIAGFSIAQTETTVAQFKRFVESTRTVTLAERNGGGEVYEAGWTRKPGWNWRTPFGGGKPAGPSEPAVHVTFDEAQAFCRWAGGRLPTDAEWVSAAYDEQRSAPPAGFERGKTYLWPSGASAAGVQCLDDCGLAAKSRAINHGAPLWRGHGHALVSATPAGVNGLHDMGGNAWEWVDEPRGAASGVERRTRGGSWWYGQAQMRADHLQSKPVDTTAVYIGFRCARGP
jgi:formylglycine-generating enzyme